MADEMLFVDDPVISNMRIGIIGACGGLVHFCGSTTAGVVVPTPHVSHSRTATIQPLSVLLSKPFTGTN